MTSLVQYRSDRISDHSTLLNNIFTASQGIILASLSYPLVYIRIVALAISIFGSYGQSNAIKINYLADKLHAILITHNMLDTNSLFGPNVLCRAKNIATKNAVWREEDIHQTRESINLLMDNSHCIAHRLPLLTAEGLTKIENYQANGAVTKGICVGVSLFVIHLLIFNNVGTEQELVELLQCYEYGFPALATALQHLQYAIPQYGLGLSEEEQNMVLQDIEIQDTEYLHRSNELR